MGMPIGFPPLSKSGISLGSPPLSKSGMPLGSPPLSKSGMPLGSPPLGKRGLGVFYSIYIHFFVIFILYAPRVVNIMLFREIIVLHAR
jgi:hypothetical protein